MLLPALLGGKHHKFLAERSNQLKLRIDGLLPKPSSGRMMCLAGSPSDSGLVAYLPFTYLLKNVIERCIARLKLAEMLWSSPG